MRLIEAMSQQILDEACGGVCASFTASTLVSSTPSCNRKLFVLPLRNKYICLNIAFSQISSKYDKKCANGSKQQISPMHDGSCY